MAAAGLAAALKDRATPPKPTPERWTALSPQEGETNWQTVMAAQPVETTGETSRTVAVTLAKDTSPKPKYGGRNPDRVYLQIEGAKTLAIEPKTVTAGSLTSNEAILSTTPPLVITMPLFVDPISGQPLPDQNPLLAEILFAAHQQFGDDISVALRITQNQSNAVIHLAAGGNIRTPDQKPAVILRKPDETGQFQYYIGPLLTEFSLSS